MDFWNIVLLMLIIVPAIWVASLIIQFAIMAVVLIIGAIINLAAWLFKKVKGEA